MKPSTRRKPSDLVAAIIIGCVFLAAVVYMTGIFGVPGCWLEKDIRSQHHIADEWTVEGTISDQMAIYLCYPEDQSCYDYSFYLNRPGLSFGYFFCVGGSVNKTDNWVGEIVINGYTDRAYFSMNLSRIARAEISDGKNTETITLDSNKPFTLILPVSEEETVTFYDTDGKIVETRRVLTDRFFSYRCPFSSGSCFLVGKNGGKLPKIGNETENS